jgi:hypothetical protein
VTQVKRSIHLQYHQTSLVLLLKLQHITNPLKD